MIQSTLFLSQREPKTCHKQNLASSDPCEQILETRFFFLCIYVHNRSFLDTFPNFITKIRTPFFRPLLSRNSEACLTSFTQKRPLLYFKRVNVPTVSKAWWQSIPCCWSAWEKARSRKVFRVILEITSNV